MSENISNQEQIKNPTERYKDLIKQIQEIDENNGASPKRIMPLIAKAVIAATDMEISAPTKDRQLNTHKRLRTVYALGIDKLSQRLGMDDYVAPIIASMMNSLSTHTEAIIKFQDPV
jgi:hypothetical protein